MGTVNITVGTPPALPVAQPESVTVVNATATPITAIAGGGTGTLTYTVVTGPTNGTLSVGGFTGATITYTPTGTYSGNDSFTYKVTDSSSHVSNTATISIFVTLAPPVANSQSLTTPFNTPLTITLVATAGNAGLFRGDTAHAWHTDWHRTRPADVHADHQLCRCGQLYLQGEQWREQQHGHHIDQCVGTAGTHGRKLIGHSRQRNGKNLHGDSERTGHAHLYDHGPDNERHSDGYRTELYLHADRYLLRSRTASPSR